MSAQYDPIIDRFLDALWLEKGLSDNTRDAYRSDLALFNGWLDKRDVRLVDAGRDAILDHLGVVSRVEAIIEAQRRGRKSGAGQFSAFFARLRLVDVSDDGVHAFA